MIAEDHDEFLFVSNIRCSDDMNNFILYSKLAYSLIINNKFDIFIIVIQHIMFMIDLSNESVKKTKKKKKKKKTSLIIWTKLRYFVEKRVKL